MSHNHNAVSGSVLLDTSLGRIVIDLYAQRCPNAAKNILTLCSIGYYTNDVFYNVQRGVFAEFGDVGGRGGACVFPDVATSGFAAEGTTRPYPVRAGTVLMSATTSNNATPTTLHTSRITVVVADGKLQNLPQSCTVLGHVAEGLDVVKRIGRVVTRADGTPMQRIRIHGAYVLHSPMPLPAAEDVPPAVLLCMRDHPAHIEQQSYVDSEDEEAGSAEEAVRRAEERHRRKQEHMLRLLGDIPIAAGEDVAPLDNILFVCRLNQFTADDDLAAFFAQFGRVVSCEIMRDKATKQSLQYAFIEFEDVEACRRAYLKADNVLIDDRRIHVDFSQSVRHVVKRDRSDGAKTGATRTSEQQKEGDKDVKRQKT
eukprot:PhM_4_TR2267/c0_g1_i1/m.18477/K12735/PPIL4; peptidyl-prolyl cis-trans isomerase-like 4